MSLCRQQAFIEAPADVVWELIADVNNHTDWWPRVVEVECEGLEEGCAYRQVTKTPFGNEDMLLRVADLTPGERFTINCVNTGTFVRVALTEARGGTFIDAEMGMQPDKLSMKVFDAVAGKRYFQRWLEQTVEALDRVAARRAATTGSD